MKNKMIKKQISPLEKAIGWLALKLVPESFLFSDRMSKWYERNGYHKFKMGDRILPNSRFDVMGYDSEETLEIIGHDDEEGEYITVGDDGERHRHYKCNIESLFSLATS